MVVMDNLRMHKGERVRQAIKARGCQVLLKDGFSIAAIFLKRLIGS
jgi:hypothetical protein